MESIWEVQGRGNLPLVLWHLVRARIIFNVDETSVIVRKVKVKIIGDVCRKMYQKNMDKYHLSHGG